MLCNEKGFGVCHTPFTFTASMGVTKPEDDREELAVELVSCAACVPARIHLVCVFPRKMWVVGLPTIDPPVPFVIAHVRINHVVHPALASEGEGPRQLEAAAAPRRREFDVGLVAISNLVKAHLQLRREKLRLE